MKSLALVAAMLRYRVASLLLPFFLLAPALHGRLNEFRWAYVAGVVALCASYVVATSVNDVFDIEVDRVNHPRAQDRPLVTGSATARQLWVLAAAAAVVALVAAVTLGPLAVAVIVGSLTLNVAYSVPPVRLCSRPTAAPVVLGIAYVALPYALGLVSSVGVLDAYDARVIACFVALFAGRMLLKDFRDRRGDAAFGKRTFLLTYGKNATLATVLACLLVGDLLLVTVLPAQPLLLAATETYFVAIVWQLHRLWRATHLDSERFAIALGARMGNAVVLTLLGFALLSGAGAGISEQGAFVIAIAAMFWFAYFYVSTRPDSAMAAYRG